MTRQVLTKLLQEQEGVTADGDVLAIDSAHEASLYVGTGTAPLIIERVEQLRTVGDSLVVKTRRGETYLLAYEDVQVVRLSQQRIGPGY